VSPKASHELFRTPVTITASDQKIALGDQVVGMGSCFAAHMGQLLHQHKFRVLNNPFGTLFNPVSCWEVLRASHILQPLPQSLYLEQQGIWKHHFLHASLSANSQTALDEIIAAKQQETRKALSNCDWLLITLGTAVVYRHKHSDTIVANCHKVPAQHFNKGMLSVEDVTNSLLKLLKILPTKTQVLVTVSPVRHLKESLPTNSVSKSVLRVAAAQACQQNPRFHYFPAYEIMLDELRDYRFYAPDMLHPNETAIGYIWKRFGETYFSTQTEEFIKKWGKIAKAMAHRPFHAESEGYRQFLQQLLQELKEISSVGVEQEIEEIEARLTALSQQ